MAVLAVAGGLLLAIALILRESQLVKERALNAAHLERLQTSLNETRAQLKRTIEDVHVLECVLEAKHVIDRAELAQGRIRYVEAPRRAAAERDALARTHNVSPTQLVMDEDPHKVH